MRIYLLIIGFVINHLIIRFTNALINMLCCAPYFISSVLRLNRCVVFLQNAIQLKVIRASNRSVICPRKWVWGSTVIFRRIINLGPRYRWVVRFTSTLLNPSERGSRNHWIVSFVGPKAGLGALKKEQSLCFLMESNPDPSVVSAVT
jgi:hypothetical protein